MNCDSSVNYTLTHDAAGNMTDDGALYTYQYDAFGRLKKVATRGGSPVDKAVYRYNGLGHRIMWQYDVNANGSLANSERYYFCYDERWRMIATYRDQDATVASMGVGGPKERFVYHAAGMGGLGPPWNTNRSVGPPAPFEPTAAS